MPELTRFHFDSKGVSLSFIDTPPAEGTFPARLPILLIHGFASSLQVNWISSSWISFLNRQGYRVIALDNRGHGQSTKFYHPTDYHTEKMAEDACRLLDDLSLPQVDVMGYSMGARIAAFLALRHPQRIRRAIWGGLGHHLLEGESLPLGIAEALEAPRLEEVTDPIPHLFRVFAETYGNDLKALAACIRGSRQSLDGVDLQTLIHPTLVAVGTRDVIAGDGARLAALLPQGFFLPIPGRDHNVAVGDRVFKEGVLDFLGA